MPDHDNPIRNLTRRCFSLLTGLVSSVVPWNSRLEVCSVCFRVVVLIMLQV